MLLTSGYAEVAQRHATADGVAVLSKPYLPQDLAAAFDLARSQAGAS